MGHVFNGLENSLMGHVENVPHVIYSQAWIDRLLSHRSRLFQLAIQKRHDQRLLHFAALEAELPSATFVGDFAVGIDHVKAGRHSAVSIADRIVNLIDQKRHRIFQLRVALLSD